MVYQMPNDISIPSVVFWGHLKRCMGELLQTSYYRNWELVSSIGMMMVVQMELVIMDEKLKQRARKVTSSLNTKQHHPQPDCCSNGWSKLPKTRPRVSRREGIKLTKQLVYIFLLKTKLRTLHGSIRIKMADKSNSIMQPQRNRSPLLFLQQIPATSAALPESHHDKPMEQITRGPTSNSIMHVNLKRRSFSLNTTHSFSYGPAAK
ncbi:hypothetical protein C2S53_000074 [Perilla frutescens var. hirtella]|uniref:Uncharacterized protein n=1 Tax=Perilla frutescens var. hirtella TaxID=608512 RepID=A0AAD4IVK7_PERFH|nr:hypothetical protein C2S53_000074 [Perilla frutescens var. hirtella]